MILNLSHGITSLFLEITKPCGKQLAGESAESTSSDLQESQRESEATWNSRLQPSLHPNQFTNAVCSMVWDIYGKYNEEGMSDLDVHLAIWRMFMYTTLQALISICPEYDEISSGSKKIFISRQITDAGTSGLQYYTRTTNLEKLFGEVKSQKCELSESLGPRTPGIIGLKLMEYGDFPWRLMSLLSEKAERFISAKVYVVSDSVLCQGEINNPSTANQAWRKKIEWYGKNNFLKDLNGIDGRKTENSYGGSFQDSQRQRSRKSFTNLWIAHSVNLKNSKDESSLCRC